MDYIKWSHRNLPVSAPRVLGLECVPPLLTLYFLGMGEVSDLGVSHIDFYICNSNRHY